MVFSQKPTNDGFIVNIHNAWNYSHIEKQEGFFTISSNFGVNHVEMIADLLKNYPDSFERLLIDGTLIKKLRSFLRYNKGITKNRIYENDEIEFTSYSSMKNKHIKKKYIDYLI